MYVYIYNLGKDSCGGDSGGPLMVAETTILRGIKINTYTQIGIVSWGATTCGTINEPGIYTNVAYFNEWILDHLD